MKNAMSDFQRGLIVSVSILSVWQDAIGKDAYIEMVSGYWAPAWISVPLALSLIAFCLCTREKV